MSYIQECAKVFAKSNLLSFSLVTLCGIYTVVGLPLILTEASR